MIAITGAAGFIGSCLVSKLNRQGRKDLILVDDFSRQDKMKNLAGKDCCAMLHRNGFFQWLAENHKNISFLFHLGARTDTTEQQDSVFKLLNVDYSKNLWRACATYKLPMAYASSAATYGAGEHGYSDEHDRINDLKPLNPYGKSKHDFDKWVLQQQHQPPFWAGLKFFNVYGPNEYHKGRMASAIWHIFHQIQTNGQVDLFRSHKPGIADGEQQRDFVYVKDVVDVCAFFLKEQPSNGIYNLGTGKTNSFKDLARCVFDAMKQKPVIRYVDTPELIRTKYQYFTEAKIDKLRDTGYGKPFSTLEKGVADYVNNYLEKNKYY